MRRTQGSASRASAFDLARSSRKSAQQHHPQQAHSDAPIPRAQRSGCMTDDTRDLPCQHVQAERLAFGNRRRPLLLEHQARELASAVKVPQGVRRRTGWRQAGDEPHGPVPDIGGGPKAGRHRWYPDVLVRRRYLQEERQTRCVNRLVLNETLQRCGLLHLSRDIPPRLSCGLCTDFSVTMAAMRAAERQDQSSLSYATEPDSAALQTACKSQHSQDRGTG